jgi:hypothetical protein
MPSVTELAKSSLLASYCSRNRPHSIEAPARVGNAESPVRNPKTPVDLVNPKTPVDLAKSRRGTESGSIPDVQVLKAMYVLRQNLEGCEATG